jgi:hypothetical protein
LGQGSLTNNLYTHFIGIAAANTGGITINQFSGIGPQFVCDSSATLDEKGLLQSVCGSNSVVRRWREASVLIIDEISMMSPTMLQVCAMLLRTGVLTM